MQRRKQSDALQCPGNRCVVPSPVLPLPPSLSLYHDQYKRCLIPPLLDRCSHLTELKNLFRQPATVTTATGTVNKGKNQQDEIYMDLSQRTELHMIRRGGRRGGGHKLRPDLQSADYLVFAYGSSIHTELVPVLDATKSRDVMKAVQSIF